MLIQKVQLTLELPKLFIDFSNFLPSVKKTSRNKKAQHFSFLIFSLGNNKTRHDLKKRLPKRIFNELLCQ